MTLVDKYSRKCSPIEPGISIKGENGSGKAPKLTYIKNKEGHLLIDGTYFSNEICLFVFRDNVFKQTQRYRITDGEHYEEMKEDLENIMNLGIKIRGIICNHYSRPFVKPTIKFLLNDA